MSKTTKRWSAKRKMEVVLRLLAGESLDEVARDIGVESYRVSEWRDRALEGMTELLKSGSESPEAQAHEAEKQLLQAKLGEVVMDNELLRKKIEKLEAGAPFARRRRSKR